jgi:hypothetical protein
VVLVRRFGAKGAHLGTGRGRVKRAWWWSTVKPLNGSRQSRAMLRAGVSTKARWAKAG